MVDLFGELLFSSRRTNWSLI